MQAHLFFLFAHKLKMCTLEAQIRLSLSLCQCPVFFLYLFYCVNNCTNRLQPPVTFKLHLFKKKKKILSAICVPGMYPSGFDYMAPPPPYPGPPQNWAAPPQNWTAPPPQPPPGLFLSLSLFHSLPIFFFFFLCATALVRSDLSASTWITSKHAIKKRKEKKNI